ncbi:hypothetical protein LCGC14_1603570 [marine sediment metagenome]|uniref:Uncharacterized protein n=1 Tax=marine sediment metagenome TaxID=412755 RepID=A0A0F9LAI7_9ZZZZ
MSHEDFTKSVIPARIIFLITPSDTVLFRPAARGISMGTAGDLAVVTIKGDTVTIPNGALAAGIIHPIAVRQVLATGTVATDIVGYA